MEATLRPPILDHLSALADDLRSRILLILERQELTVSELCAVLQLPQSTVSRHLKTLTEAGWATARPDGTRRLYRLPFDELEATEQRLWILARAQLEGSPAAGQDRRRLESVLRERRSRSEAFFASEAGGWDRLRDELFGTRFYLFALLGLLGEDPVVGDLGCGTGPISEALAPWVRRVIAVDGSEAMVEAARARLIGFDNVEVRRGELEAPPLEPGELDAATLVLVLHHLPDPGEAVAAVARALRPGGRLLVVDMLPHERQEYRREMGHVWMGFSEEQLQRYLAQAGLMPVSFRPLVPESAAKGPALFAATATRLEDR
jgi:ArsR family transcriptional regulator